VVSGGDSQNCGEEILNENLMQGFEMLEHPGDVKIRAQGKDLAEVFANAARGMMAFLYGEDAFQRCHPDRTEEIMVEAGDLEALLVDWLSELLTRSNTDYRLYLAFEILEMNDHLIKANVGSCPAEAIDDIKAVTYHELFVGKRDGQWVVEVVFDI